MLLNAFQKSMAGVVSYMVGDWLGNVTFRSFKFGQSMLRKASPLPAL
jgi:hypothetical protein